MAFVFNQADINMEAGSRKQLEFAGDYLVKVADAKYQGKSEAAKTAGADKFWVEFEVMDGSQQGARFRHFFLDDSSATEFTPFRYREINALLAGIGGVAEGTTIELTGVKNFLPGKILAVRISEFEKSTTDKGKVVYNPKVANFGRPIKESVPNEAIKRPEAPNGAEKSIDAFSGATPTNAQTPFDVPANDPFA